MREIKFRGKRKDNNEWVYGSLLYFNDDFCFIIPESSDTDSRQGKFEMIPVELETVGQYIELKDEKDVDIYEGDICKVHIFTQELGENMGVEESEKEFIAEMCFNCIVGVSVKNNNGDSGPLYMYGGFEGSKEQIRIIGNTTDNPKLMEAK